MLTGATCVVGPVGQRLGHAHGTFQVYVGDSSALANLPLHGTFALGRGHGQG